VSSSCWGRARRSWIRVWWRRWSLWRDPATLIAAGVGLCQNRHLWSRVRLCSLVLSFSRIDGWVGEKFWRLCVALAAWLLLGGDSFLLGWLHAGLGDCDVI
jgi:hypothetical protein